MLQEELLSQRSWMLIEGEELCRPDVCRREKSFCVRFEGRLLLECRRQCEVRTLQPTQAPTENNLDCSAISSSKTCNNQAGCFYRDRKHGCLLDQCSFGAVRCKRVTSCTWASGTCRAAVCDDFKKNNMCKREKHGLHCSWDR